MIKTDAYKRIGFCIYCRSTKPPLTREHVIPRGLGGSNIPLGAVSAAVLGKASCESCRKITHEFETYCQTKMFENFRIRAGLKQSAAPAQVAGSLKLRDGTIKEILAHPEDLPAHLVLPVFARSPGIFLSVDPHPNPVFQIVKKTVYYPRNRQMYPATEVDEILTTVDLDLDFYQRMLAKIALGGAIIKYGFEAFDPIICNYIRGKEDGFGRYVYGYPLEDEKLPYTGEMHSVMTRVYLRNGIKYVITFVRLFAYLRAPTNAIVVGTIKENAPIAADL